jgi:hypothetical protein
MREKGCGIGLVLMVALTAACARPTPEPAFWTEPCPNLPPETPQPIQVVETLERLPLIPTDTPVELSGFIARVGNFRWIYEYFDPHTGKPVRSECPWLSFEWEVRRKTADKGSVNPLFLTGTGPAMLETQLYLDIGHFLGACYPLEQETWDPDPEGKGEEGEGYRYHCLAHVRPEWGPRWLVIQVSRGAGGLLLPIPITLSDPIARVEVPPPPPAPER